MLFMKRFKNIDSDNARLIAKGIVKCTQLTTLTLDLM